MGGGKLLFSVATGIFQGLETVDESHEGVLLVQGGALFRHCGYDAFHIFGLQRLGVILDAVGKLDVLLAIYVFEIFQQ